MLVEHGADVNKCNVNDQTPLMICALFGRFQIMSYLLAHGANVNTYNVPNALQTTHTYGHSKCVELLLEHGADESTLQGYKFGIYHSEVNLTNQSMKYFTDLRRKTRYCEYPECSSNKKEKDLNACMRCKLVHYCCVEHQRLHWPEHKKKCKELIV